MFLFDNEDCLLTVSDLANQLKISRSKAYTLVNQKGFPVIKLGKCIRISQKQLKKWLHI